MDNQLPTFIPLNYSLDETLTPDFLGCCLSNPLDPYQGIFVPQGIAPTTVKASVTVEANTINPDQDEPICRVVRQVLGYCDLLHKIAEEPAQRTNIRKLDDQHGKSAYVVVRIMTRGKLPVSPQSMPSNQAIQLAINPPKGGPAAHPAAHPGLPPPLPKTTALLQCINGRYRVVNSSWFQNHIWPTEEIYGFEACKIALKPEPGVQNLWMRDGSIETSGRVIKLDELIDDLI